MKTTEKYKLDRKNVITSIVVLIILLFITISCALPQQLHAVALFSDDNVTLENSSIVKVNEMEPIGKGYKMIGNDSYIVFSLPENKKVTTVSVKVHSKEDLYKRGIFQVYYAKTQDDFSEKNSVKTFYQSKDNADVYLFKIPKAEYSELRIDINASFTNYEVSISDKPLQIISQKQPINMLRLISAIIIAVFFFGVLFYTKRLMRLTNQLTVLWRRIKCYFIKKKWKIFKIVIIYISILIGSVLLEVCYFRLVNKVPNSIELYFDFFRFLFILGILVVTFTLLLLRKSAGTRPEYLFLAVGLIAGTLLTAGLPPTTGVSWDDQIHYKWASTALVVTDGGYTSADETFFDVTNEMQEFYSYQNLKALSVKLNVAESEGQIASADDEPLELYQRLSHFPVAITLKICTVFQVPFVLQIFLARLSNLFVYLFIMFLAIKKLSSGKMILCVLALSPTFLFLACNFSYDYWVTAFLTLGFVYYLEALRKPNQLLQQKELFVILGCFLLGCGPKAIYFIFFLLPLFMPKGKIESKKFHYVICLGAMILTIASLFLVTFFTLKSGGDIRGGSDVNSVQQVIFILTHPVRYAKILVSFLLDYWNPEIFVVNNHYFANFAYLGVTRGSVTLIILLFITAFTDKNKWDSYSSRPWVKTMIFVGAFGGTALIATSLYISFNPVANLTIGGCQPRYIFPFLFPVFSVIGSCKFRNNLNPMIYNYAIISVSSIVLFWATWEKVLMPYQ